MAAPSAASAAINVNTCAGIIYHETAGLRGTLHPSRIAIGSLAYKIGATRGLSPVYPTAAELQNPAIKTIWNNCVNAAVQAQGKNPPGNHYIIWPSSNGQKPKTSPHYPWGEWPYTQVVVKVFGPVSNPVQNGDVPAGSNIYFFWYNF